jgi:hypothetical protein
LLRKYIGFIILKIGDLLMELRHSECEEDFFTITERKWTLGSKEPKSNVVVFCE